MNQETTELYATGIDPAQSPNNHGGIDFDLQKIINIFLSNLKPIVGITILFAVCGVLYLAFQDPVYTATSMLQLNTGQRPVLGVDDNNSIKIGDDSAALQSQLDVINSPAVLRPVVEEFELFHSPEFVPNLRPKTLVARIKGTLRSLVSPPVSVSPDKDEVKERQIIAATNTMARNLSLRKDPLSYTVRISYTSLYPERAQKISNAIAASFITYQVQSARDDSSRMNTWYASRAEDLRERVVEAERAVQDFSEKNNLFEFDGKTLTDRQISDLNTQLAQARAEKARAEARLERVQQLIKQTGNVNTIREVLDSVLIQRLREKEADLLRQKSELSGMYGSKHPKREQINREISDLRSKISIEINKILANIESEVIITKSRIKTLEADLEKMRVLMADEKRVQLGELQRQAEASRLIYESFLTRTKETGEAETIEQGNAKIIAPAQQPTAPSAPKKKLIMVLFLMCGTAFGVGYAFLIEVLAVGINSPDDVERLLGIQCLGMIPKTRHEYAFGQYIVDHPNSLHAQSIRSIAASFQIGENENKKSYLIVSALPQEGKGSIAYALSTILSQSGKKVILIDCDLHKPMTRYEVDGQVDKTLNNYLNTDAKISDIISTSPQTELDIVFSEKEDGRTRKLLESDKMNALIAYANQNYDFVIIDSPPIIGLGDSLTLCRLCDSAIMVVRWSDTPKRVAQNAVRLLKRAKMHITGAVLTRVDLDPFKTMAFGNKKQYKKYKDYYHE